jgi:hypothetical protein
VAEVDGLIRDTLSDFERTAERCSAMRGAARSASMSTSAVASRTRHEEGGRREIALRHDRLCGPGLGYRQGDGKRGNRAGHGLAANPRTRLRAAGNLRRGIPRRVQLGGTPPVSGASSRPMSRTQSPSQWIGEADALSCRVSGTRWSRPSFLQASLLGSGVTRRSHGDELAPQEPRDSGYVGRAGMGGSVWAGTVPRT